MRRCSRLRSRRVVAYLGSLENLGTESCKMLVGAFVSRCMSTYACHQLEHTSLCLVEQHCDFVQTGHHLGVLANSAGHATSERVAQVVVDVQLAGRSWRKESVVQAWDVLDKSEDVWNVELTVRRSKVLPDEIKPWWVCPLRHGVLSKERLDFHVKGQILFTVGLLQEFSK